MKRVVGIGGSPRKNGNSDILLKQMLVSAGDHGIETEGADGAHGRRVRADSGQDQMRTGRRTVRTVQHDGIETEAPQRVEHRTDVAHPIVENADAGLHRDLPARTAQRRLSSR